MFQFRFGRIVTKIPDCLLARVEMSTLPGTEQCPVCPVSLSALEELWASSQDWRAI